MAITPCPSPELLFWDVARQPSDGLFVGNARRKWNTRPLAAYVSFYMKMRKL
jgi:hypothetical protein